MSDMLGLKIQTVIEDSKTIQAKLDAVLKKVSGSIKIDNVQFDDKVIKNLETLFKNLSGSTKGVEIPLQDFKKALEDIQIIGNKALLPNGSLTDSQKIISMATKEVKELNVEVDKLTTIKDSNGAPIKQIQNLTDAYGQQIKVVKTLGEESDIVTTTITENYKKQRQELERLNNLKEKLKANDSKSAYSNMESLLKQEYRVKTQIINADEKENELLQQQLIKIKELQSTQAKNIVNNGLKNTDSISSYQNLNSQLSDKYDLSVVKAKQKELEVQKQLNESIDNYLKKMDNSIRSLQAGKHGKFVPTEELNQFKTELSKINQVSNMDEFISKTKVLNNQFGSLTASTKEMHTAHMGLYGTLKHNLQMFSEFYIVGGLFMGVVNTIKSVVTEITVMDTALTNLNKVVDMSKSQINDMKNSAIQMGKELGQSATSIVEGMAEWGRVTKNLDEIKELTKVSTLASNVTDLSVAQASKSLESAMIQFKLQAKDAIGVVDQWNEIKFVSPYTVMYM